MTHNVCTLIERGHHTEPIRSQMYLLWSLHPPRAPCLSHSNNTHNVIPYRAICTHTHPYNTHCSHEWHSSAVTWQWHRAGELHSPHPWSMNRLNKERHTHARVDVCATAEQQARVATGTFYTTQADIHHSQAVCIMLYNIWLCKGIHGKVPACLPACLFSLQYYNTLTLKLDMSLINSHQRTKNISKMITHTLQTQ